MHVCVSGCMSSDMYICKYKCMYMHGHACLYRLGNVGPSYCSSLLIDLFFLLQSGKIFLRSFAFISFVLTSSFALTIAEWTISLERLSIWNREILTVMYTPQLWIDQPNFILQHYQSDANFNGTKSTQKLFYSMGRAKEGGGERAKTYRNCAFFSCAQLSFQDRSSWLSFGGIQEWRHAVTPGDLINSVRQS